MDHPGFELLKPLSNRKWLARFRGGVGPAYFKRGVPVRLLPGDAPATIGKRRSEEKTFELESQHPVAVAPVFAVWELEDFAIRRGRIVGRACDDLIGVAAALATLILLKSTHARVNVIGALSRAEEVGFHGALALAADHGLPAGSLVVSLETSRELPGVSMGSGVILRVGDKASTFDSAAMRFLAEVATESQIRRKGFRFQRALMSGGTCEASAYQEFGYQCGAVCIPLGNYHNCGPRNRVAAEYVSIDDLVGMVELLASSAKRMPQFKRLAARLPVRLHKLLGQARRRFTSERKP